MNINDLLKKIKMKVKLDLKTIIKKKNLKNLDFKSFPKLMGILNLLLIVFQMEEILIKDKLSKKTNEISFSNVVQR